MSSRYIKSDESKKILYIDANKLYGHSISLPYENKFDKKVSLEDIIKTLDDSDNSFFYVECDLKNSETIKEKTKFFPCCPENKISPQDKISDFFRMR